MRSSTLLVIASAALASASPIEKRDGHDDNGFFKRVRSAWGANWGQSSYTWTGNRWGGSSSSSSTTSTAAPSSTAAASATSVVVSQTLASTAVQASTTPSQVQTSTAVPPPATSTTQPATTTAATSSASSAPATPTDYASSVVSAHNTVRHKHANTPDVTYDATLASYALTLAQTCVFAHDTTIGGGGYGQNLASGGSTSSTESSKDPNALVADSITNGWYNNEVANFLPSYYGQATPDMSNFAAWGHFSQVVWKSSVRVGCATHYCASGTPMYSAPWNGWFTVCNYSPAGNVGGQYGNNIGALL